MVKLLKVASAGVLGAFMSTSAIAGGVYADSVSSTSAVTCVSATDAAEICSALGSADGVSAALGDGLLFDFGTQSFNTATLFFAGIPTSDFALQFMGTGGTVGANALASAAEALDMGRFAIEVKVAGLFETLSVAPAVPGAAAEIDAVGVSVTAIPLPASAALLLVGVGAIGISRRRKA